MSWTLTHRAKPWTVNAERSSNRWRRAEMVDEWRGVFHLLALEAKVPALTDGVVVATQTCRTKKRPDAGSCYGAVKAAVDGLVDAGVFVDDGPDIVRTIVMHGATTTGEDSLTLTVFTCDEWADGCRKFPTGPEEEM